jgi:hypothetical protein
LHHAQDEWIRIRKLSLPLGPPIELEADDPAKLVGQDRRGRHVLCVGALAHDDHIDVAALAGSSTSKRAKREGDFNVPTGTQRGAEPADDTPGLDGHRTEFRREEILVIGHEVQLVADGLGLEDSSVTQQCQFALYGRGGKVRLPRDFTNVETGARFGKQDADHGLTRATEE